MWFCAGVATSCSRFSSAFVCGEQYNHSTNTSISCSWLATSLQSFQGISGRGWRCMGTLRPNQKRPRTHCIHTCNCRPFKSPVLNVCLQNHLDRDAIGNIQSDMSHPKPFSLLNYAFCVKLRWNEASLSYFKAELLLSAFLIIATYLFSKIDLAHIYWAQRNSLVFVLFTFLKGSWQLQYYPSFSNLKQS